MPEVVSHGRTGFLVSSIEEAFGALERVKELERASCRGWVEQKFSADRMVDEYIRVYERIVAGHGRKHGTLEVSNGH
jgi:glycosyltransferase involved in cell wall biosynthesis